MKQAQTVAVIVPLLNEIKALPTLLAALCRLGVDEILIVDGGSTDGSQEWLAKHMESNVSLISSERGRALQMNQGAQHADSDMLLFLHADTILPKQALAELRVSGWGRFDIEFYDNDAPESCLLKLVSFMINKRSRISGVATGDQAMFVERALFEKVGGFKLIPIMEDVELSKRLRQLQWPICTAVKVGTSARRWKHNGIWKTILLMWGLRLAYVLGGSPDRLHKLYRHVR